MKQSATRFCHLLVGLCLMLLFARCAPVQTDVTNEIKQANESFLAAFNSGDTKALATNYTENAKLYPANSEVLEGTQAIEGFWGAVMKMGIKKAEMETLAAQQIGNVAIEEGRYKLFVEGDIMVDQGKYLVTWEKVNGQWKIARDIWNTNNPAPLVRANAGNAIWVITHHVKADKVKQFEDFNMNYLKPAGDEVAPDLTKTVRFLKSEKQNQDGTYTYFYLMDPVMSGRDYGMKPILTTKYGQEKADEYVKMYYECLKDHKVDETIQTGW